MAAQDPDMEDSENSIRLQKNWSYLMNNLDPGDIMHRLHTNMHLRFEDLDYIDKGDSDGTRCARLRRLLDRLKKRNGDDALPALCQALTEEGLKYIVDVIENTPVHMGRGAAEGNLPLSVQAEQAPAPAVGDGGYGLQTIRPAQRPVVITEAKGPVIVADSVSFHQYSSTQSEGKDVVDSGCSRTASPPQRRDGQPSCVSPCPGSPFPPLPSPAASGGCPALLHQACRAGDVDKVTTLLSCHPDVNRRDGKGRTPLFYAVDSSQQFTLIVRKLLKCGAAVGLSDKVNRFTPLHLACCRGHVKVARELLKQEAPPNACDIQKQTPLYLASQNDRCDAAMVEALALYDADMNLAKTDGTTPLMAASKAGNASFVSALLKHQAGVSPRNLLGQTALHLACLYGSYDAAEVLLQHSSPLEVKDVIGFTPLYCASQSGNTALVKLLLQKGASVDALSDEGATPLYIASENGHVDVVIALIRSGARVNIRKKKGHTPLIMAAKGGYERLTDTLIQHKAEVNVQNNAGWTPLHAACYNGRKAVASILLKHGAHVNTQDEQGATPLHRAFEHLGEDTAPTLLEHQADVQVTDNEGRMPLHVACFHCQVGVCRLLVDKGAPVCCQDKRGKAPIHVASKEGHKELINFLVENRCKVNVQTHGGETPLHKACKMGRLEAARELIQQGSTVNAQNKQGNTPLHCAVVNGHDLIFSLLLKDQANTTIKNNKGETPDALARQKGWL